MRIAVLLLLAGCAAPPRSALLGPADARGPIALAASHGTIEIAWVAGAPLHVVTARLDEALTATVDEGSLALGASFEPALARTLDGTTVLAYRVERASGGAIVRLERVLDGAFDPPSEADVVSFPPTAFQPTLATDARGRVHLAFDQWTASGYGVSVARREVDGSWRGATSAEQIVSPHRLNSNAPRLAVGPDGTVLLGWYQALDGPLLAFGAGWDEASETFVPIGADGVLSVRDGALDSHPIANARPAVGPHGEAAIVWAQEVGSGVAIFAATRSPAGAWTLPRSLDDRISDGEGHATCPAPTYLPDGTLVVVWQADAGEGWSVHGASFDGAWSGDALLVRGAYEPALITHGDALVLAVTRSAMDDVVALSGPSLAALGPPTSVSSDGERGAAPALLSTEAGAVIAYLEGTPARLRAVRLP